MGSKNIPIIGDESDGIETTWALPLNGRGRELSLEEMGIFKNYPFGKEQFYHIDRNLIVSETEINFGLSIHKRSAFKSVIELTAAHSPC